MASLSGWALLPQHSGQAAEASESGDADLVALLEPIRLKHSLPALAGAIVTTEGVKKQAATGMRKAGGKKPVTIRDLWHLGSDTKAMTSVLAGIAVDAGKLSWDSTLESIFPRVAGMKGSPYAAVTLTQLLSHRSGMIANLPWGLLAMQGGKMESQRSEGLKLALRTPPANTPGSTFLYSNTGYMLAGHMIEEVLGREWEQLMQERVFKPLGIKEAGFGGVGTPGREDQPWPHLASGKPTPMNGPAVDNLPVLGPAGTVHASLSDWALFIADQLAGAVGKGKLLKPETYARVQSAAPGGDYGYGWGVSKRAWAGGKTLSHDGDNTMNHCSAWVAPEKGLAFLACTNQGDTGPACDEAISALVRSAIPRA